MNGPEVSMFDSLVSTRGCTSSASGAAKHSGGVPESGIRVEKEIPTALMVIFAWPLLFFGAHD